MSTERIPVKQQDFLDNDPPIRGQNYVCLSFVSPEAVIVKKDVYFLHKFLNYFSSDVGELLDNLSKKFENDPELVDMCTNLKDRYDYLFHPEKLQEEFEYYKTANSVELEKDYLEKNNYQTSMRGIKVRGVYETLAEAQKRCHILKDTDGKFDVYVAEVGCWCPWNPNPDEIQDQEYAETELNTLVKKYKENVAKRSAFQKERAEEMVEKVNKQRERNTDASTSAQVTDSLETDPWMQNKEKENIGDV